MMQEAEHSAPLKRLAGSMLLQGLRGPPALPGGLTVCFRNISALRSAWEGKGLSLQALGKAGKERQPCSLQKLMPGRKPPVCVLLCKRGKRRKRAAPPEACRYEAL